MIEILLQAERALAVGLVDQAERLYRQAADADPRNSIAVVGLARVALERGDEPEAWRQARRALAIDPENVAAQRLADRLEEVWAYRGESLPDAAAAQAADACGRGRCGRGRDAVDAGEAVGRAEPRPQRRSTQPSPPTHRDPRTSPAPPEPSVVDRLLRRNRP